MLEKEHFSIQGVGVLLMHNVRLADPLDQSAKALKKVSSKRKKTEEDFIEMSRIEFFGGFYWNGKNFVLPAENWESALVAAAKKTKQGPIVRSGVFIEKATILLAEGPSTPAERWEAKCFDRRIVKVGIARIMRTRPSFEGWSTKLTVTFDPEIIDVENLRDIVVLLGKQIGVGDYRPRFGRFDVVES